MRRTLSRTRAALISLTAAASLTALAPLAAVVPLTQSAPYTAFTSLHAQDPGGARPGGWEVLTDELGADTTTLTFVDMEPGFHLTTGPAALFYDPDVTARGAYRAEANVHLFEPAENGAFGLFVGGGDLDGSYQTYTALLLRPSGELSVVRRLSFTSSETLVDWTAHEAVRGWEERTEDGATVENSLAVETGEGEMVFFVNGREVARVPRASQGADGIVGIRAEEDVDIHVTGFGVEGR